MPFLCHDLEGQVGTFFVCPSLCHRVNALIQHFLGLTMPLPRQCQRHFRVDAIAGGFLLAFKAVVEPPVFAHMVHQQEKTGSIGQLVRLVLGLGLPQGFASIYERPRLPKPVATHVGSEGSPGPHPCRSRRGSRSPQQVYLCGRNGDRGATPSTFDLAGSACVASTHRSPTRPTDHAPAMGLFVSRCTSCPRKM